MNRDADDDSSSDGDLLGARELSHALTIAERRRCEAQRLSGVGFWELNHLENTLYWSEEIFAIYGIEANSVEPNYDVFVSLIHDDDRDLVDAAYLDSVETGNEYDIRYRIKAGADTKWIEARGVTYYGNKGEPERSIGTARDISEVIDAQQATEHLATHDALTDLPNRKLFSDRMTMALRLSERQASCLAVLFIDLDNFKRINDRHGHDVGDEVLVGVARALEQSARSSDTFARIGGDEFAGLLVETHEAGINSAVSRLKDALETSYRTREGNFDITASIGVTIFPVDPGEPDELLRHADHAMYEAKESGRSRIRYFDTRKHQSNRTRHELLRGIERALARDEFVLHYQPRLALEDGTLAGAEALLRWFRSDGAVSPARVISAIEGTSLEWELDTWVTQRVLKEIAVFRQRGLCGPFSLNLNPSTIENPALPEHLRRLLNEADSDALDLEIEILEVSSIKSFERTRDIIRRCKALGASFSLDDFGTGYSSLTYFHSLPVDKLKIDQQFVKTLLSDSGSLDLVKSILAIARTNGCPVVAEGVESHAIAGALVGLGCDYGQGYGLARPMPPEDYVAWALDWEPRAFLSSVSALDARDPS